MSNRLEQFIRDNREQFDTDEPNPQLWKKLESNLTSKTNTGKTVTMIVMKWMVAAAILVLAGLGVFSLLNKSDTGSETVKNGQNQSTGTSDLLTEINPEYAKEVNHFTRLIEIKQTELKQLEKENPALYRQFITDINKLDSSYNALQKELPANPNREQLLEAMIQNLRLQTGLLNQQLQVIQKINKSKKNNHESNSKSI